MAASPVFPRKSEALAILDEELERVGCAGPVAFTIEKQKRPGSQKLAWWQAQASASESADAPRNLAYLRSYVRITGDRPLPAGGLRLHKDRVWLEPQVIAWLEQGGFVSFAAEGHFEPSFVVTEKGRHWIATGEILA
jgi:hypothetical protein